MAEETAPGVVALTATGDHILNNTSFGFFATGPTIQMAEYNDWGSGEGPFNAAGTYEVASYDCGAPTVDDMLNIAPLGGLGNAASESVDYCPWTVGALCTLTTADTCYKAGDTVTVDLGLTGATENITGGQWWIEFDATYLTYVGAAGQAPWDGYTVVNPGAWAYPPNVKFIQVGDLVAPLGALSGPSRSLRSRPTRRWTPATSRSWCASRTRCRTRCRRGWPARSPRRFIRVCTISRRSRSTTRPRWRRSVWSVRTWAARARPW